MQDYVARACNGDVQSGRRVDSSLHSGFFEQDCKSLHACAQVGNRLCVHWAHIALHSSQPTRAIVAKPHTIMLGYLFHKSAECLPECCINPPSPPEQLSFGKHLAAVQNSGLDSSRVIVDTCVGTDCQCLSWLADMIGANSAPKKATYAVEGLLSVRMCIETSKQVWASLFTEGKQC